MKLGSICFLLVCIFSSNFAIFREISEDNENSSIKVHIGSSPMRFLYVVKIFSRENRETLTGFSCSGSIVHQQWIITAGHCVYNFKVFDVFIGKVENDVNHVVGASQVFLHPNYTFDPELMNDLALLKLKRSLNTLNNTFEVISMPQISHVPRTSLVGLHGIVAGYGKLSDSGPTATAVNWAHYEVLSLKECRNFFQQDISDFADKVICVRGIKASTCQGDSGQGLVIFRKGKKKLVGIVSNGYESCENVGEPEIFTRVDGYLEFIEETINQN